VGKLIGAEEVLKTLKFCAGAELDFKHGVLLAISRWERSAGASIAAG
jgi:hypothetical protein